MQFTMRVAEDELLAEFEKQQEDRNSAEIMLLGGSILSTRCSETYETKAALLSLFGVPLWYFSQSPRAVIQGLDDESQERGKLLGTYTYDEDGEALQTYSVTEENDRAFQIIEVQVLSNWGHQEYTCMYRFRVHGTPQS